MGIKLELKNMKRRSKVAGILGVSALLVAGVHWRFWGRQDVLTLVNPMAVATPSPDDLWFLPNGGPLVAVGHDEKTGEVWIRQWTRRSVDNPVIATFDFATHLRAQP